MREDLASLDADALVLLANKGLVRRASRRLDKGQGPSWTEADDGTVDATFPDGVALTWPPAVSLAEATCSCGAPDACWHGVAVALAYTAATPPADWSPGDIDDLELEAEVGPHAMAAARRWAKDGLWVRLEHTPVPVAHLPSGTVRFVAGPALHLAHCDVSGAGRGALVAVAVWAFRQAEGAAEVALGEVDTADLAGLDPVMAVVRTCLEVGIADLPDTLAGELSAAIQRCREVGWVWISGALEDLEAQWAAHATRSTAHSSVTAAALLGELVGRARAVNSGGSPRLLGAGVAPLTKLDHVTLIGLGATTTAHPDGVRVDVYLLDLATGTVLVLTRVAELSDGLARVRVGRRLDLAGLATQELATRSARRSASRRVTLGDERGGFRHALRASPAAWDELEAPVLVPSLEALRAELRDRPPRCLRPRLLAEDLRVVPIAETHRVLWAPGAQELVSLCTLPSGDTLRLVLPHDPLVPGACGALQAALERGCTHVAGHLRVEGHALVMTPTAVRDRHGVLAPALAPAQPVTAPAARISDPRHPLTRVLETTRARLADVAHLGLHHDGARRQLTEIGARLKEHGLRTTAGRVHAVADWQTWADAWLTAEVALQSHL